MQQHDARRGTLRQRVAYVAIADVVGVEREQALLHLRRRQRRK